MRFQFPHDERVSVFGIIRPDSEEHQMIRIETREIVAPSDAAARLGISTRRLLQIVEAGELPAITDSGRRRTFRVEDIEQLASKRARAAGVK